MNKEREIDGIKVIVSNETYNEYKGTLQDQINELQDRIDKAIEVLEKEYNKYNREFDSYQIWLEELLDILKGDNK